MRLVRLALLALLVLLMAGCSPPRLAGAPEPPEPRERVLLAPEREPGAPRIPWSQKTREQRIEYMGLVVFPEMKTAFQKHDEAGFRQFRCQTCHGEDMVKVRYAMPSSLLALPADDPVTAAASHDEETTRFMVEEVVPRLRRLLEQDESAPASAACATCHPGE